MATVLLQPPESFNFHQPDLWLRWKQRFEQFRLASGLSEKDDARQISSLLYCMGQDAEDVLKTTSITDADRRSYAAVVKKFDDHFAVRRNVIYERAKFNTRRQQPGETGDQYILALYTLAESCKYARVCRANGTRDSPPVGSGNLRCATVQETAAGFRARP